MRFTVRKWYFVWDFEKKIKWLNEMAAKGMNLVSVGFCKYVFEEGTPGEYRYNIEWLAHSPSHPETIAYVRFLEDTGIEHIGFFKRWAFFRKKTSEGTFDLYSDLDSRIIHFRRILTLLCILLVLPVYWIFYNLYMFSIYGMFASILCALLLTVMFFTLMTGLIKTVRSYLKLKKERIMKE